MHELLLVTGMVVVGGSLVVTVLAAIRLWRQDRDPPRRDPGEHED